MSIKEAWCIECQQLVAQRPVEELMEAGSIETVDHYYGQCSQCGDPSKYGVFDVGPIDVEDAFENYFLEDLRSVFEKADLETKGNLLESLYKVLTKEEK